MQHTCACFAQFRSHQYFLPTVAINIKIISKIDEGDDNNKNKFKN